MLYYFAWLIVVLAAGLVVLWLCKLGAEACRREFGGKSAKEGSELADEIRDITRNAAIKEAPHPWGRGGHQTPGTQARTHAAVPGKSTLWGGQPLDDSAPETQRPPGSARRPPARVRYARHGATAGKPGGYRTGSSRE